MVISGFGVLEAQGLSIDALASDWELALEWIAELALESTFPADRCDWLRRQAMAELESLADSPEVLTHWGFLEQLYDPHAAGRPIQGNPSGLSRLTAAQSADYHRRALGWGGILTLAGDLDADDVRARAQRLFQDMEGGVEIQPQPPAPQGSAEARRRLITAAKDQAHLYAGHLTVPRTHPDFVALQVVAVILGAGAGLTGRIPARVREREGLAYSAQVATTAGAGLDPGRFTIYAATTPENVDRVFGAALEEVERLLDEGIEEGELQEARAFLLGREPFRRETARQWADLLAESEFYGVPVERPDWLASQLEPLSLENVQEAARRHLHPKRLKVTLGLPRSPIATR
jgi:zinc protease